MSNSPKNVADNKKSEASYPDRDEPVTAERFVRAMNQSFVSSDEDRFPGAPGAGSTSQDPNVSERAVEKTSEDSKRRWPLADLAPSSDDSEMSDLSHEEMDSESSEDKDSFDDLLDELDELDDKIYCAPVDLKKQALREAAEEKRQGLEAKAFASNMIAGSAMKKYTAQVAEELAVQKKIGELEQLLKSLKVDGESLSQSKTTIQHQLQEKDEEIMRLAKKNKKLEDNLGDAREQICSLERQLKDLQAQGAPIQSMMTLMEKQSEEIEAMKSAWQENQKAFHFGVTMCDKYWALVEEEKKWMTEHQRLMALVEEQKKESGEKDQKIRYLVDILQKKVDEDKEVEAKKQAEEEDYKSIRQLEAALCAREQQVKMLQEGLRSAEGRCFRKDQAIKELEQKSSELLTQKKDSDDKWRMKMEESKTEIERLEKTVHGYERDAIVERMHSKDGLSRIPKLQEVIQQQADEIRVLKTKISMSAGETKDDKELTHEIAVKAHRIIELENELAELKDQDKQMKAQILGLTADYEEQKNLVKSLKMEMVGSIHRSASALAVKDRALKNAEAKVRNQDKKIKDQNTALRRKSETISRLHGQTNRSQSGRVGGYTALRGHYEPARTGFSFNPHRHGAVVMYPRQMNPVNFHENLPMPNTQNLPPQQR